MNKNASSHPRQKRRRRSSGGTPPADRAVDYHNLRNPFPPVDIFSADQISTIHETALRTLEDLGIRVLLPEAVALFRRAGARIKNDMVYVGRELVEAALTTAPKTITGKAGLAKKNVRFQQGCLLFQPGAGAPHATDLVRGRRPGTARDYKEFTQLNQHFDVLQMLSPSVEPQDIPTQLRHYFTLETQLTYSNKFPAVFARGKPQAMDCFEMLRDFRGVTDDEFRTQPHCYTVINTNSPRTLDIPMAQGLIDFAQHGQLSIVTPFTLMGAMAPITVAGAITLSHAEALAAITLTQLVRPGAPVCYGTFTTNVDMKSGSPAFGTPSHFQATLAAGQMARLTGLPWRCAAGSASNMNDVQAANENQLGLWGCLMAGSSVIIHAAGWLEGGLTVSYEKIVTDVEVLNMVAELCSRSNVTTDEIGFDSALSQVDPGGHFFSAPQTMERYNTEFYEPIVHSYANYGQWTEQGALDTSARATLQWKKVLATENRPFGDSDKISALRSFIARRTSEGGAPPES